MEHALPRRTWSLCMTSENHGTVGPAGCTFSHAPDKHERVLVVEVPTASGAPVDQVNLQLVASAGRQADVDRALSTAQTWANEEYMCGRRMGKGEPAMSDRADAAKTECTTAILALAAPVAAQAGQVAVPGWTSVDERLPGEQGQDSEEVLCFLSGHCAMTDFECRDGAGWGIRLGYYDAEKGMFRTGGRPDASVTHWMPLPASPSPAKESK